MIRSAAGGRPRPVRLLSAAALAVAVLASVPVPAGAAQSDPWFDPEEFDAYVRQAFGDWGAVGLSVAVVRDSDLLFARGYGVLDRGGDDRVDADSLFAIGSTTKAMTAAALGILVDEGRIGWDDPVRRHVPEFEVNDGYVTGETTIRDLLTHRAGLPNTDLFWYGQPDVDISEMLLRLREVEPAYSMRGGFAYQNVMYAVAGEVVARVSGLPWPDFVSERIFAPLRMTRTAPTLAIAGTRSNVASPHFVVDGETTRIENAPVDAVAAAGSVWSSANEMSLWLRMLLRGGTAADGTRVLAASTVEEMFRPQALVDRAGFYPTQQITRPKWVTYGLGWFQQDYAGHALDFHTGSIDGMVAIAGLVRSEGVGVFVLGNLDHVEVRHALMLRALDALLGGARRDWSGELKVLYDGIAAAGRKARETARASRVPGAAPRLALAEYAGDYAHPVGGGIEVRETGRGLRLEYGPGLSGPLSHWHYDAFLVEWDARWRGDALVQFRLDSEGKPAVLAFGGMDFRRVPPPEDADRPGREPGLR